jgi:hypothetical protein
MAAGVPPPAPAVALMSWKPFTQFKDELLALLGSKLNRQS